MIVAYLDIIFMFVAVGFCAAKLAYDLLPDDSPKRFRKSLSAGIFVPALLSIGTLCISFCFNTYDENYVVEEAVWGTQTAISLQTPVAALHTQNAKQLETTATVKALEDQIRGQGNK